MVRPVSAFTRGRPTHTINGYDFISERVLNSEEAVAERSLCQSKILNLAFNSPICVHDYRQFMSLAQMFKAMMLVVYVDPNDKQLHQKVLASMVEARNEVPIELKQDDEGDFLVDRNEDIIFVLTTNPNLMFFNFSTSIPGPQAMILPFGETENALETYLKKLQRLDDQDVQEWLAKAANAEQEFAVQEGDDSNEQNRKESL